MIGAATVIAVCITLFVTLLLPLIIYIIYGIKNKGKGVWLAWLLGAAAFFVTQMVIRTPILSVLSMLPGFQEFAMKHYLVYCFALAFTAALFELAGRYVAARLLCRKGHVLQQWVAAGLGHGSIEAMLIVGMTYVNNLIYIVLINTGAFEGLVEQTAAQGLDTTSLLTIRETFLQANSAVFYLAGYERVLTIICQVAMTMIVCYYVSRKQDVKGLLICLAFHWGMDFVAPVINGISAGYLGTGITLSQTTAYFLIYGFLTVMAAAALVVIRRILAQDKPVHLQSE